MSYTNPSLAASGTTFAQFQAGGPSGHLERVIGAQAATAAPGAPTISATGGGSTGGNLPAGTIYVKVTESNGIGETTASSEANVAISSGDIPQVTFAALQTGNVARRVYVGTASGAETLYATGVTAATLNLSAAIPTNSWSSVAPPTVNTTGLTSTDAATGVTKNSRLAAMRACEKGRLQAVWDNLTAEIGNFNRGEPISFPDLDDKLRAAHATFAALAQVCAEMGALVDANPGTLGNVATGIGGQRVQRHWP